MELARCVVEMDNSSFMPPEFHEFLVALDVLDQPSSAATHFDEAVWSTLVRVRRLKIESELKVFYKITCNMQYSIYLWHFSLYFV